MRRAASAPLFLKTGDKNFQAQGACPWRVKKHYWVMAKRSLGNPPLAFLHNLVTFPQLFLFVQIQKCPDLATSLKLGFIIKETKGVYFCPINWSHGLWV